MTNLFGHSFLQEKQDLDLEDLSDTFAIFIVVSLTVIIGEFVATIIGSQILYEILSQI